MGGWEVDAGVEDGEVVECKGDGFDDEWEGGEFRERWGAVGCVVVAGMGVEFSAERGEGREIVFVGVEEVRDGEGAGHCFEHGSLDRGEWDGRFALGRRVESPGGGWGLMVRRERGGWC